MAKKNKRHYTIQDEDMLEHAQTIKNLVEDSLIAFSTSFPWVDAAYLTSFQNEIDAADDLAIDYTINKEVKVTVADTEKIMAQARQALRSLFHFAKATYPLDKKLQRIFGQQKMGKARNSHIKMLSLLALAHSFASKNPYKNDLLTRGYTQTEIDGLKNIADALRESKKVKGVTKTGRQVITQDRIVAYNLVFERIRIINKCAQVVYMKNPARKKQFRIYP